jgi:methionine-rich copper-binding protein CopC
VLLQTINSRFGGFANEILGKFESQRMGSDEQQRTKDRDNQAPGPGFDRQNSLFLAGLRYFWRIMKNHNMYRAHAKLGLVTLFIGILTLAAPGTALAHARLVKSTPASGAELAQAPEKVELWFSELLDGNFDNIGVYAAADVSSSTRTNLVVDQAKVDDKDRTHLAIGLKPLPPGVYFVEWRVLSLDGHTATGRFKFKVQPAK